MRTAPVPLPPPAPAPVPAPVPVTLLLLLLLLLFPLAPGCSSSRTIIPYAGPDGKAKPFVFRHDMRAKDAESREPVAGALAGVKSSDDAVWQVDWTDDAGTARLSQEYAEWSVYNDQRSIFFVNTQNTIKVHAPSFDMAVRHPIYEPYDLGYGAPEFVEVPREEGAFACAVLVRPHLVPLERKPARATATAVPASGPSFDDLLALPAAEVTGSATGAMVAGVSAGPAVHGGRFTRTTGPAGVPERACKVYHRYDDGAYVLLATYADGAPRARAVRLCDTADLVLHASDALPGGDPAPVPGKHWVRADRDAGTAAGKRAGVAFSALDAGLAAGVRQIALLYPLAFALDFDRRLRERKFELLAEWWLPLNEGGTR